MSETCNWVENDDGFWVTGCGHFFVLNDGTPSDNQMHWCPYCGKSLQEMQPDDKKCKKCGGIMSLGKAIQQTWSAGVPDFPGDQRGITMSPGGGGKLIDCLKCKKCGFSITDKAVVSA